MRNQETEPWYPLYLELKSNQETKNKYDHPGIYKIEIEGKLVYIGKSTNMLCRLAQHIFYTSNINIPTGTNKKKVAHKYIVFNLAQFMGYQINFSPIYYASSIGDKEMQDEIGFKEGELIRANLPPLNYQIPKEEDYHKYTVNKKAETITLMEILGKNEKIANINY